MATRQNWSSWYWRVWKSKEGEKQLKELNFLAIPLVVFSTYIHEQLYKNGFLVLV